MERYVFYNAQSLDPKLLTAARKTVKAMGVNVMRSAAGTMLIEAGPSEVEDVAKALPGWRYSPETKTHRVPECTPLQRAKLATNKG